MIVDGYSKSNTQKKLVIVGNFQDKNYENFVRSKIEKNENIIFTGGIYEKEVLNMLRSNSFCYLHGHSAGGTNPALHEAMTMGKPVIAHDNDFNRHVLDDSGLFFSNSGELCQRLDFADSSLDIMEDFGAKNSQRTREEYTWEKCFEMHELNFESILQDDKM